MGAIRSAKEIKSNSISNSIYTRSNKFNNSNSISIGKPTNSRRNKGQYTEQLARSKADYIARTLGNAEGTLFYMKVAWNLTDQFIDWLLNYVKNKKDKARYFSKVASNEMKANSQPS